MFCAVCNLSCVAMQPVLYGFFRITPFCLPTDVRLFAGKTIHFL